VEVLRAALQEPVPTAAAKPMADRVLAAIAAAPVPRAPERRHWSWGRAVVALLGAAALLGLAFWLDGGSAPPPDTETVATQDPAGRVAGASEEALAPLDRDAGIARLAMAPVGASDAGADAAPQAPPPPGSQLGSSGTGERGAARDQQTAAAQSAASEIPGSPPEASAGLEARGEAATRKNDLGGSMADLSSIAVLTIEDAPSKASPDDDRRRRLRGGDAPPAAGPATAGGAPPPAARKSRSAGDLEAKGPLDGSALRDALDAFLARMAGVDEPVAVQWPTPRGELRASPFLADLPAAEGQQGAAPGGAPPRPADLARNEPLAVDRCWLVEGPRADIELLLQRIGVAAAERRWTLRPGQVPAPKELRQPPAAGESLAATAEKGAVSESDTRILIRLRLRAR
jgi:hypothetical protein